MCAAHHRMHRSRGAQLQCIMFMCNVRCTSSDAQIGGFQFIPKIATTRQLWYSRRFVSAATMVVNADSYFSRDTFRYFIFDQEKSVLQCATKQTQVFKREYVRIWAEELSFILSYQAPFENRYLKAYQTTPKLNTRYPWAGGRIFFRASPIFCQNLWYSTNANNSYVHFYGDNSTNAKSTMTDSQMHRQQRDWMTN